MNIFIYTKYKVNNDLYLNDHLPAGFRLRILNGLVKQVAKSRQHWQIIYVSNFLDFIYVLLNLRFSRKTSHSTRNFLIIHKSVRIESLLLIYASRILRFSIIFDICDVPYASIDSFSSYHGLAKAFILSLQCNLSTLITTSSQSLKRSFINNAVFIPDTNDAPNERPLRKQNKLCQNFNVLWFGSAGSVSQSFGLIELINSKDDLLKAAESFTIHLFICTNFTTLAKDLRELANSFLGELRNSGITCSVVEWSTQALTNLFSFVDLCYLPTLSSLKTFTKSANRALYSLQNGVPTLVGYRDCYTALRGLRDFYSGQSLSDTLALLQHQNHAHIPANQLLQMDTAIVNESLKWVSLLEQI